MHSKNGRKKSCKVSISKLIDPVFDLKKKILYELLPAKKFMYNLKVKKWKIPQPQWSVPNCSLSTQQLR